MKKAIILGVLILSVTIPALSLAAQNSISTSASASGSIATVTIQSNTALPNSLLDLELYDANGNKAAQAYVKTDIPNGSLSCSWNMFASAGAYTLRIGVFNDNWTTLYNWNNSAVSASGPFTGDNHITCSGAQVQPVFSTFATSTGGVNSDMTTFTIVQADKNISNVLIDTEIYDAANTKVDQWWEVHNLVANQVFELEHPGAQLAAGNYKIKVGLFSSDWSTQYIWNNTAGAFTTVATSSGNPLPPPSPPPANNTGVITPSTQTVQSGASVDFTGHNFGHEETVLVARNGANVSSVHADGGGNFSTGSVGMPNANGTYVFTFTGQISGIVGTSTIQIGPVSQPPPSAGSLTVALSPTPLSQGVAPGVQHFLFATINLDATGSPEDMRMSSIPLSFTGDMSAINNCQIWFASTPLTTGVHVVNTLSTTSPNIFTFDDPRLVTAAKGTIMQLSLYCDVSNSAFLGIANQFGINSTYAYSALSIESSSTVQAHVVTANGPSMTISSPSLTVATDSSAPAYALVAGGTTGVPVNVLKLRASNEPIVLQKIGLKLTSGSAQDLTAVNLYAGTNIQTTSGVNIPANTLLGTATFLGNSTIATSTLTTQIQLPKDVDSTIVIKADIASVGTNQPGTEGDLIAVDYRSAQGTGANSGNTIFSPSLNNSGVAGVRIVHTLPVVSMGPGALTISGGSNQVLEKFNITASNAGMVGLSTLNFAIATTSLAVTNLQLHAYTDSAYSTPANVPGSVGGQFGATVDATTNAGLVNFQQTSNPFEIGAGSTMYFALTGNVTPAVSATTWSVSSTLLGDTAFDGLKQANTISGNFVWSPNATSTAAFSQNDWTNGFGVAGLPTAGVTQTRSN
jgi:hypothetical protein